MVPPKFTTPSYRPAINTFPLASVFTPKGYAESLGVDPPILADHVHVPLVEVQAGVLVLAVELCADWLPALSTAETLYE